MARIDPEDAKRARSVEVLGGVARSLAHPVATAFRAFQDEGLTEQQALYLAEAFMRHLLGNVRDAQEDL